jgi:hypothetical protein
MNANDVLDSANTATSRGTTDTGNDDGCRPRAPIVAAIAIGGG